MLQMYTTTKSPVNFFIEVNGTFLLLLVIIIYLGAFIYK
jgi:hypothetical protein